LLKTSLRSLAEEEYTSIVSTLLLSIHASALLRSMSLAAAHAMVHPVPVRRVVSL
jgi:hypothetical protein